MSKPGGDARNIVRSWAKSQIEKGKQNDLWSGWTGPKGTWRRTIETEIKTARYEQNNITRTISRTMIEAEGETWLQSFVQKLMKALSLRKHFLML